MCQLGAFICTFAAYKAYMCERGKWYHRANMSHGVQVKASTLQVCVCVLFIQRKQGQSPGGN